MGGVVNDPTLARERGADVRYFPGVRYTRAQVLELLALPTPFVDQHGRFGLAVPAYDQARLAAFACFSAMVGAEFGLLSRA